MDLFRREVSHLLLISIESSQSILLLPLPLEPFFFLILRMRCTRMSSSKKMVLKASQCSLLALHRMKIISFK